jgi:molybdenum-dependent DNA-binding transcriptional regulator ModE
MAKVTMEWESRLGRRLRVRDLYILSTVAKSRSMAKAARELAMSQPAVSEAIANLEHILAVRLPIAVRAAWNRRFMEMRCSKEALRCSMN